MSYSQPSLLGDDFLRDELRQARAAVDHHLQAIREFTVIAHDRPWLHLDDLLGELRAAAVTVQVLERTQVTSHR